MSKPRSPYFVSFLFFATFASRAQPEGGSRDLWWREKMYDFGLMFERGPCLLLTVSAHGWECIPP